MSTGRQPVPVLWIALLLGGCVAGEVGAVVGGVGGGYGGGGQAASGHGALGSVVGVERGLQVVQIALQQQMQRGRAWDEAQVLRGDGALDRPDGLFLRHDMLHARTCTRSVAAQSPDLRPIRHESVIPSDARRNFQ